MTTAIFSKTIISQNLEIINPFARKNGKMDVLINF
jgi:hypothetical protein